MRRVLDSDTGWPILLTEGGDTQTNVWKHMSLCPTCRSNLTLEVGFSEGDFIITGVCPNECSDFICISTQIKPINITMVS